MIMVNKIKKEKNTNFLKKKKNEEKIKFFNNLL